MNGNVDTHQQMCNAQEIYTINMINCLWFVHTRLTGHCTAGNSERDNEKFGGIGERLTTAQVLILISYNETLFYSPFT